MNVTIASLYNFWGYPYGVMVQAQHCRIIVNEFKLQAHTYIHFCYKYPWETYEPLIFSAIG